MLAAARAQGELGIFKVRLVMRGSFLANLAGAFGKKLLFQGQLVCILDMAFRALEKVVFTLKRNQTKLQITSQTCRHSIG